MQDKLAVEPGPRQSCHPLPHRFNTCLWCRDFLSGQFRDSALGAGFLGSGSGVCMRALQTQLGFLF